MGAPFLTLLPEAAVSAAQVSPCPPTLWSMPSGPSEEIVEFLSSLPAGSVVVQLDDGTIDVCEDLEAAEARLAEAASQPCARGWRRIAAYLQN